MMGVGKHRPRHAAMRFAGADAQRAGKRLEDGDAWRARALVVEHSA